MEEEVVRYMWGIVGILVSGMVLAFALPKFLGCKEEEED